MMYEIKMKILFKVREFVWVIVSEIEDWVYPYRTRLSPEEKYEHEMKDPITGEITMIENLIQNQNQRIERLQDEMISVMNRLYNIEQSIKSINTYQPTFLLDSLKYSFQLVYSIQLVYLFFQNFSINFFIPSNQLGTVE